MKEYTWDEIYDRAIGAAYGDPELQAKDEARHQLRELILEEAGYDIDEREIPEEEIESFLYCREKFVLFDVNGNIVIK